MKKYFTLLSLLLCLGYTASAQVDVEEDDDDDLSIYENFELPEGSKITRFATPKILGLAPAKLVSVGYDFQGPNTLTASPFGGEAGDAGSEDTRFRATHGPRIFVNLPVISNTKFLLNMGVNYLHVNYISAQEARPTDTLARTLLDNGLRSMGVHATVFKPLSERKFVLGNVQADHNGDFGFSTIHSLRFVKYSWAALYGIQPSDRKQYGFGVTQTYRAGEFNLFPIILYNYTAANRKWGIEALLPARFHYRRNFNSRNILLLGYELEGQSYRLNTRGNTSFPVARPEGFPADARPVYNVNELELRRAEIRIRAIYERALSNFFWVSTQVGYVHNYRFNVDSGNFFRGFHGSQPYLMQNRLSNPLYLNVSINFVSP